MIRMHWLGVCLFFYTKVFQYSNQPAFDKSKKVEKLKVKLNYFLFSSQGQSTSKGNCLTKFIRVPLTSVLDHCHHHGRCRHRRNCRNHRYITSYLMRQDFESAKFIFELMILNVSNKHNHNCYSWHPRSASTNK